MSEKIVPLGNGIKVIISDKISFTTDSILLANFALPTRTQKTLEIGTGCGIIPLLWCRNSNSTKITAVEIDTPTFEMMKKSINLNKLEDKITLINEDIRQFANEKQFHEQFDMIVCNPPYYSAPTKNCNSLSRTIARHEKSITIEEITQISSKLLKNGGYLCLCCRTDRLCDIIFSMKKNNIEPKILRFVEYKEGTNPKLFLIKGKKNAKSGIVCQNNLIIQTKDGIYTEEANNIYKFN